MKRLRTLTLFQIFSTEIKKSKTYSGWCPFKGLSNGSTLMQIQSGRTVPLTEPWLANWTGGAELRTHSLIKEAGYKLEYLCTDWRIEYRNTWYSDRESGLRITCTLHWVWVIAKFGTCTIVSVMWHLLKLKCAQMHIHPWIYAYYYQQVSHLHSRGCKCQI